MKFHRPIKKEYYMENIYDIPMKNIVDFEKTLSVDEAIAQSKTKEIKEKKEIKDLFKKKNQNIDEPNKEFENQLLKFK